MSNVFFFNTLGKCNASGITFDGLCVAYGYAATVSSLEFYDDLERAIKASTNLPDCLIVIADESLLINLKAFWEEEHNQRETILARGNRKGHVFIKSYYFYAWSTQAPKLLYTHPNESKYSVPIQDFINQGLKSLINDNNVVQIAPAGHTFRHPSGNTNKIFIQTRELAINEPQLQFVANTILIELGEKLKTAQTVFVDTMGIYHFVRAAIVCSGGSANIECFHSYDELEKASPPQNAYACVISASTSGGMARKLVNQGFDPELIITLVDRTSTGRLGKVLIKLDAISQEFSQILSDGNDTEIEIVGEHFTSKAKPPRPVALGVTHRPPTLKKILEGFGLEGFKHLNYKPSTVTANSKLLYLDVSALGNQSDFLTWLKEELSWTVSSAIDYIVHADDPASEVIANIAARLIKEIKGKRKPYEVTAHKDIDAEKIKNAKGVLVISAIAGDGSTLREIGRDLREFIKTSVPRHFLVAVGLPQTEEVWARLKQFLERNSSDRRYGFSNWFYLPIGYDGRDTAWRDLSELAQRAGVELINNSMVTAAIADQSFELLIKTIQDSHNNFLPKSNGEMLSVTEGFIFFDGVFDGKLEQVPSSAAYLAMSSALQKARELKDSSNSLKPSGYESVVLAPECFLRFNDNILQACLLRACHPSELDYSASPDLSKLIKEFLTKIFQRHEHHYGGAALEFAAALATGRMKLKNEDFHELVEASVARLSGVASPLLGLLLFANEKGKR